MKRIPSPLAASPLRPLSLRSGSGPGRPRYLSAASGLVATGGELCVVADDELHLGRFAMRANTPGRLVRLLPGELPIEQGRRKRRKPDLEVLMRLPPVAGMSHGGLLALGSGSRATRRGGVLLPLDAKGLPTRGCLRIDASPLFVRLAHEVGELNIEGGWTWRDRFFLLQRGMRGAAPNAVMSWSLAPLLRALVHEHVLPEHSPRMMRELPLGSVDGVALGFTDGTPLPDGGWMFCAVAEDADDSYGDGRFAGAAVGMVGPRHGLHWMRRLTPDRKVEGIEIDARSGRPRLLLVTDADDPQQPAWLLEARP